ncbi:MAG: M20/M25/M40 family metallo-hydrolase [Planctomycetota bacterium]
MTTRPLRALVFLSVLGLAAATQALQSESASVPGDPTVDAPIAAAELRAHVQALSSDALLGRPMGSDESLAAAEYVASRLEAAGLVGGADEGSFLQEVPLVRRTYTDVPEIRATLASGETETLYLGEDFSFQTGLAAPDGRTLRCVMVRQPEDIPAEADPDVALILATSALRARRWLEEAGFPRGRGFGLRLVPKKAKSRDRVVPGPGRLDSPRTQDEPVQVSLRGGWSEVMASGDVASVTFVSHAEVEEDLDVNVVGVLAGAGLPDRPGAAGEVVVLTAHRDHIGVDRRIEASDPDTDAIRNGADDDASGCAAILEIAEALALGERPARTTVFVFVTGEESGMVGSRYWVANPTHSLEAVVAALNFEMLGRPDDVVGGAGNVWLTGYERSNLGPGLRGRGIGVHADPRLEKGFFTRSDNVSFARAGIVAQTLSTFGGHRDYHRVTDEWDTLDYDHMETSVGLCLRAVRALAAGDWSPAWNEGEPRL